MPVTVYYNPNCGTAKSFAIQCINTDTMVKETMHKCH